jgi:hypothetical protein
MDEPDWENCEVEDLWKYVAWNLGEAGIEAILVGGAVATIYTEGEYETDHIDLALLDERARNRVAEVLGALGFAGNEERQFRHARCARLYVEFPVGPLAALGNDNNINLVTKPVAGRVLKLLGPTDCVKDRLSSFIHWRDRDCFAQAVLVCVWQDSVDLRELKNWCAREGAPAAFGALREAIQKSE